MYVATRGGFNVRIITPVTQCYNLSRLTRSKSPHLEEKYQRGTSLPLYAKRKYIQTSEEKSATWTRID